MYKTDNILHMGTLIERNEDIPTVDLDGEVGMLNIETGKYYGLDAVGSHIWQLISSPVSVNDIMATLTREYNVNEDVCRADVLDFLYKLYSQKLVRIKEI